MYSYYYSMKIWIYYDDLKKLIINFYGFLFNYTKIK